MKSQVIATSLNHQIISPYTSFIAIEKQPKISSLFAKNDLTAVRNPQSSAIQAHESLMVAMPQTALSWQLQLLIGIALLLLAKVGDFAQLANSGLKKMSRHEKHH